MFCYLLDKIRKLQAQLYNVLKCKSRYFLFLTQDGTIFTKYNGARLWRTEEKIAFAYIFWGNTCKFIFKNLKFGKI